MKTGDGFAAQVNQGRTELSVEDDSAGKRRISKSQVKEKKRVESWKGKKDEARGAES